MSENVVSISTWRELLEAARHESDPKKLAPLVSAAEAAIFLRWQDHANGAIELEAIARATRVLRELQVTKLNFPAWEVRLSPDITPVGSL